MSSAPKKMGRPATGKDPLLPVRVPKAALDALDAYVASLTEESAFKTRSDLVRFIITDWLKRRRLL